MRSLESLRKEAKRWLAALRAGDVEARARLARVIPDPRAVPTLREVQHALAREQGLSGWAALAERETMAEALLDAYRTGTPEAMERHYRYTWHRRPWQSMREYVQLDLGKRGEITLDDARYSVVGCR